MRLLQRVNARFQFDIVVRQFRLLAGVACLLFDPLLTASRKGRDRGADGIGECAELVHDGGCVFAALFDSKHLLLLLIYTGEGRYVLQEFVLTVVDTKE